MNIVVIISDSLRWDCLGCYGNGWARTPNLDRFARESVVFNRAYCGSFPTIPMRADLFSGRYVFQSRGWAPLGPENRTFGQILEEKLGNLPLNRPYFNLKRKKGERCIRK